MHQVTVRSRRSGRGRPEAGAGRPARAGRSWRVAAIAIGLLGLGVLASARGDSPDQRLVEGLRQRRLFSLAEAFCRQRLNQPNQSARERAEWTVERIRSLAQWAVHAAPADRPARWRKAREAAAQFFQSDPRNPRALLVRFQDALTVLAQAELSRQEADVDRSDRSASESVRATIRQAIRLLEQVDDQVAAARRAVRRGPAGGDELTEGELASLQGNVRRQLARAYRNQALSYPRGSDDRVAALTQALRRLEDALPEASSDQPLAWEIRLEQAICRRLLGELDAARRLAVSVDQDGVPPSIRPRARAEWARVELAAGDARQALEVLGRPPKIPRGIDPEFDFAQLETFVALWRKAQQDSDASAAGSWRDRCIAMVQEIERTHGAYWARRAEWLLVGAAPKRLGRDDFEVLARSADTLYLQGLLDRAVEAYEQAGRLAEEAGEAGRAFELRYKAARVEGERGETESMIGRLRSLALSMKSDPRAAPAHLLAAAAEAEQVRAGVGSLDLYAELLQEQVATWPKSRSADTARLWRGRLYESRGEWSKAIASYSGVSPDWPRYEESVEAAGRCWGRRLEDLKAAGGACAEEAASAAAQFEAIAASNQAPAARQAALAAARILLRYAPADAARAESILRKTIQNDAEAPDAWKGRAEALLAAALATERRGRDEAESLLRRAAARDSPQPLLEALELLTDQAAQNKDAGSSWAKLRVLAANLLAARRDELQDADRNTLDRLRAQAWSDAGQRTEALAAYAQLARRYPRDGGVQEAYAQLLAQGDDPDSQSQALQQWRRVARGSRPGGPRWYRAKYAVALLLWRRGQRRQAAQLIQYLQATAGLDDTPLKSQFLQLLERCKP